MAATSAVLHYQLLMAEKVVTKFADPFWFLKGWSQVHGHERRECLRTQGLEARRPAKSPGKYFVQ
jgi:hypothetical protein